MTDLSADFAAADAFTCGVCGLRLEFSSTRRNRSGCAVDKENTAFNWNSFRKERLFDRRFQLARAEEDNGTSGFPGSGNGSQPTLTELARRADL